MRKIALAFVFVLVVAATVPAGAVSAPSWPKTFQQGDAKVVVYQPQVKDWPNKTVLNGIVALAVTRGGSATPIYGTATFTTYTSANFQEGTVTLTNTRITATRWPGQSATVSSQLDQAARSAIQPRDNTVPLATVLASLNAESALPKSAPLRNDPPKVFTSQKRAILVVFDHDPILTPIEGTDLKFAVNTNWAVIADGSRYYLLDSDHWIAASSAQGPWVPATAPASFAKIPDNDNWTEVRKYLNAPAPTAAQVPQVFVSTVPAELIAIDGTPKLAPLPPTQLKYVENTQTDLFSYQPTKEWYVLLSGRWFRAASLNGPWTYAGNALPADFKKIPPNSPRGRVLVSVPGTPVAQYVGASTQVPEIATVDPKTATITIAYGPGAPQFAVIEGTSLQYAVNTPDSVIKVNDAEYFACRSGVWFIASSPTGPWSVAHYVPPVIYTIPPSSPLYSVTFVRIYNADGTVQTAPPATPEPNTAAEEAAAAAVLVGFTAGYLGGYWYDGAWMYGTGWYYPGWYYGGAYYPYATTWTGGSYYNPTTGAYGRSASVYGPYGGASARAQYNPTTGTYARGAEAYGPNGSRAAGSFYNPRYGVAGRTVQGSDPYGSWGKSAVTTRNGSAVMGHASTSNGQMAGVATQHGTTSVGKSASGDVYAGHDGNVYRNQDGTWQKNTGGNTWSNVERPTTTSSSERLAAGNAQTSGVERQNAAAQQRPSSMSSSNLSSMNRDFSARQAGSSGFRGFSGGGGFRGGGGRGRR
ncbi:MAG TPA: hypothetical protein VMA36_03150 [Candidatus Limnocylindria bacterium]|nr:hypothetical protein [Candidatus Limnocylindria bacterium]